MTLFSWFAAAESYKQADARSNEQINQDSGRLGTPTATDRFVGYVLTSPCESDEKPRLPHNSPSPRPTINAHRFITRLLARKRDEA